MLRPGWIAKNQALLSAELAPPRHAQDSFAERTRTITTTRTAMSTTGAGYVCGILATHAGLHNNCPS
jgi:hypothetical protein